MDELTALSEQNRQTALERFQVLQPYLESQVTLRQIAQDTAIPYRTLQHWVAAYQQSGLMGLARKTRSDHGERRGLSIGTGRKKYPVTIRFTTSPNKCQRGYPSWLSKAAKPIAISLT